LPQNAPILNKNAEKRHIIQENGISGQIEQKYGKKIEIVKSEGVPRK
jgi:hypothetical protein